MYMTEEQQVYRWYRSDAPGILRASPVPCQALLRSETTTSPKKFPAYMLVYQTPTYPFRRDACMQSLCHFSRRWHQQFCRSPNFSPHHHHCLQQWRPYRSKTTALHHPPPPPSSQHREPVSFREYEQIEGRPETRRLEQDPSEIEAAAVRKQIKALERELAILKQGPFSRNSEFMQRLPEDEREELIQAMQAEGLGRPLDLDLDLPDDFMMEEKDISEERTVPLAVTLRIPAKHRAYVKRFNAALRQAQKKGEERKGLWVWYLRCQQKVPGFSTFISEDVWEFMWRMQVEMYPGTKHLVMLARDMETAGVQLSDEQVGEYLTALHNTGDTATALEIWEKRGGPPQVGAKLYAAVGRPTKAQEIAADTEDPDVILPVIKAWAESQTANAPTKLWMFYQQLRPSVDLLGQITSILLKADRPDMALAVFRDMLARRDAKPAIQDEETINRIGLKTLLALPHQSRNKFFFGAWIKWLLGAGKVDDALLVVELMQEKGIKPDARHLNGIIAAWYRTRSVKGHERAEQLAWSMIYARIDQVKRRGRTLTPTENDTITDAKLRIPTFLQRNIPPATIETFCILLKQYTRRTNIDRAFTLTDLMSGPCQIKPNSYILNAWLYLSLRRSDPAGMWARYTAVRSEITPDLETFSCLWDGMRRHLSYTKPTAGPKSKPTYPTPRDLYAEMTKYLNTLGPTKLAAAKSDFSRDLYEQIIRCFCLKGDLPGTFAVLSHMHQYFNILPHEDITSMIVMAAVRTTSHLQSLPGRAGTAATITTSTSSSRHRGRNRSNLAPRKPEMLYRAMLGDLTDLVNEIFWRKAEVYQRKGVIFDLTDGGEEELVQELRLGSVQAFLGLVLLRRVREAQGAVGVGEDRWEVGLKEVEGEIGRAGRKCGFDVVGEVESVRRILEEAKEMTEE